MILIPEKSVTAVTGIIDHYQVEERGARDK